jgi:prefoldin beta subunit
MAEKKPTITQETQNQIQEIQMMEQNFHSLLVQKQAFQLELNETENALAEIKGSESDIYKIISNIMIKTDKSDTTKELEQRKELLNLRLKSIEKQESQFSKQLEDLRGEVLKKLK